jgi:hypothetical protein
VFVLCNSVLGVTLTRGSRTGLTSKGADEFPIRPRSGWPIAPGRRIPASAHYVTTDDFLNSVFERHRGRSYQDTITFPLLVRLIADALLGHRGSAHQSFLHAQTDQSLGTTVQAVYRKLARVPLELSLGVFAEAAPRLRDVGSAAVVNPRPASVAGFCALGFDGKKIKYLAKRLAPLRGLRGDVYGGKLLIAQDRSTQQAVAAQAVADGEAADNPLVPALVSRIRATHPSCTRLWLGDRAFCDFKLLGLLSADADEFLVRFNTSCGFHPDPSIGGTPQATVFQAMLGLLLYNITMTIRDFVADGADRHPRDVSLGLLFGDLVGDLTAWVRVIGADTTVELLRARSVHQPDELRRYLRKTLGAVWTDRWKKSPKRKRPPKSPPRAYICGGHTPVDKVLRGEH